MTTARKDWIIQKCNNAFRNDYEAWPDYDQPMTRDEMLIALDECNQTWPTLEFRGHRIGDVVELRSDKDTAADDAKLRTAMLGVVDEKRETQPAPKTFDFPKIEKD